ncbi:gephyrin-like molybdotransferase Glp [Actinomyces dentalis]|uniref:molybdopterin molybdotransferase MoeA n=1 Tax=Actinomyces dentalis TaxID=272548 RepID=UPI0023575130|nr:gephyrin-like molybdotransferase Glp [Actinomyces dentalis]
MGTMQAPEAYIAELLAALEPLPAVVLPLAEAHGLVLAEDATAALPVPPWTNSAMDGYAVRAADAAGAGLSPVVLPVGGDVPAGAVPAPLEPGTAQRIMTGAMLPEGADAVVRVEDTDQEPGPRPLPERVEIRTAPRPGLNVRRAGENVGVGDPVLGAGAVLSAAALSALASTGAGSVRAVPRARVAVVSTGAELVDPGAALPVGSIPDSNSVLLSGLVVEHGAALASVTRSADTAASLAGALTSAAASADLIVTSGGVSAGAFDPLTMLAEDRAALDQDRAAGAAIRLRFARVAMQPGKPQGHGTVRADDGREVPLIMLPGNPVSVLVSFRTIVAPALARLMGHDGVVGTGETSGSGGGPAALVLPRTGARPPVRARAAEAWKTAGGRRQYIPVRFVPAPAGAAAPGAATAETVPQPSDGAVGPAYWVAPTHRLGSGSHLVASLPAAQALAVVAAGTPAVGVGDEVRLIALSRPAGPGGGELPPPPAVAH